MTNIKEFKYISQFSIDNVIDEVLKRLKFSKDDTIWDVENRLIDLVLLKIICTYNKSLVGLRGPSNAIVSKVVGVIKP